MQKAVKKDVQAAPHFAGIDGLKGLAIIAIVLYHVRMPGLAGGFIGVELFFVIAGYLDTRSILERRGRGVPHPTRTFYARRLRRLYPTLLIVVLATLCLAGWLCREALVGALPRTLGALTFTYNWVDIAHGSSYFSATVPEPLKHVWYVALLAQFLVVAPWLVALLARIAGLNNANVNNANGITQPTFWRRVRATLPVIILCLLAAASAAGMIVRFDPNGDPTRVYFGTDTHCFALLLGMAFAWHAYTRTHRSMPVASAMPAAPATAQTATTQRTRYTRQLIGWTGIAILVLCIIGCANNAIAFRGGLAIASLASLAVLQAAMMPGTPLEALMSNRALATLGRHSYGIYLWHYPLYVIATAAFSAFAKGPWWHATAIALAIIALSLALTWFGDRCIATPVAVRGFRRCLLADESWNGPAACLRTGSAVIIILALAGGSSAALASAPCMGQTEAVLKADSQMLDHMQKANGGDQASASASASDSTLSDAFSKQIASDTQIQQKKIDERDAAAKAALEEQAKKAQQAKELAEQQAKQAQEAAADPTVLQKIPTGDQMSMVGDSVMLGASPSILAKFPGASIDAKVSRHVGDGLPIINQLASSGTLRPWVVVGLGTNGTVTANDIAAIDAAIGQGRNLVLVTGYADRSWIAPSNQAVKDYAAAHSDHVIVADWNTAIAGHTDLLLADGFHPTEPEGGDLYAQTLYDAIALWLKSKG